MLLKVAKAAGYAHPFLCVNVHFGDCTCTIRALARRTRKMQQSHAPSAWHCKVFVFICGNIIAFFIISDQKKVSYLF